jgi:hypothetical protein
LQPLVPGGHARTRWDGEIPTLEAMVELYA